MMRPLRTIAYWVRRVLRPLSVRWTDDDSHEWEWECSADWTEDEDA